MPKIRDLGISHIPLTMRPPEIGLGGAYDILGGPDAALPIWMQPTQPATCHDANSCETNSGGQCVPSGCPESCGDTCGQSGQCADSCGVETAQCADTCGETCPPPSGRGQDRKTSGLERDTIIQLKQHLQERLGTQLQM